jgi:peptide/nickel transport system substrate-binding protein
MDPARSRAYFRRAYETIIQDAPAIWMYELQGLAGVHRRLNITGMRPDAWWAGLSEWTIAPDQRIDRDRIGLRTPPG